MSEFVAAFSVPSRREQKDACFGRRIYDVRTRFGGRNVPGSLALAARVEPALAILQRLLAKTTALPEFKVENLSVVSV